ncbi:MAG: hypothetical protein KBF96_03025 [Ignavibacteria bacterium]|jgi:hypothetical protein|nr:hypothetical protein [Ignavibacteria bacterium]
MKKNNLKLYSEFLLAVVFTLSTFTNSFSQTLFVENFNFPVMDSLENTGGWRAGNNPYNVKVVSPGLSYSGYTGSGIGNSVVFSNPVSGELTLHDFTNQTSGTVYMSFLLKVDSLSATATEGLNICLDAAGATTFLSTAVYIKKLSSTTFNVGISKVYSGPATYSPTVLSKNTTYLVICSYTFVSGLDNDICKLYVSTSGVPATEPAVPSAVNSSGYDTPSIGEVTLLNSFLINGLQGSSVKIDGIRIGTTWSNTLFQPLNVQLNLKALIQGFYSSVTDKMIKDTATVFLRYKTAPYTIADSSKAVLDSNGNGAFLFSRVGNEVNYYISVKHRNTIESWSNTFKYFYNNSLSFDFLSHQNYTYGQNVIKIGNKYCFFNGDVNQDRSVDLNDVVAVNNNSSIFAAGYKNTDVTGDNYTDLTDLVLTNNNSSKFIVTLKP